MVEIGFYHLTTVPLERALPRLLEKVLASGHRALVWAASAERVEALNAALWTYAQESFLPHGTAADGFAAEQPILLTTTAENVNAARVLVLVDGAGAEGYEAFDRCLDLFDGNDPEAVAAARARWRQHREVGRQVTYWRQNSGGGWEAAA
ncbi:MAG: DNA polymerase III subunit chi [Alphaproteobacteria bacterium]|nr:DNA polymerase III subunit chi [Alphaproteobacteria bacterium]